MIHCQLGKGWLSVSETLVCSTKTNETITSNLTDTWIRRCLYNRGNVGFEVLWSMVMKITVTPCSLVVY
jgi:hypothetical protein